MSSDATALRQYHYRVFGLRVRSCLELPELIASTDCPDADVEMEFGAVPDPSGSEEGLFPVDDALVLVIPGVARYRIAGGAHIRIDPAPDVPERNVRLFLLGSAFGALLHQRGLLPLHANAVEIDGKVVAFMGASGEGKSTLAAWFHDRGYRVVADDVCVVRLGSDGRAYAAPGQQRLRLWKEALEATGRDSAAYVRSFAGREDIDKFDVPFDPERRLSEERELAAIYLLDRADSFSIERLAGLDAAEPIFSHTYRGQYVTDAGSHRQHWQSAVALAQSVPMFRIDRRRDLSAMDEQGRQILDHVAATFAGG
jgi:hypothetical protein